MEQRQESTNTTNKTSDIFSNVAPLSLVSLVCEKKYENKYQHSKAENKKKGTRDGPPEAAGAAKEPTKHFPKGEKKKK